MPETGAPPGWGPSHQTRRRGSPRPVWWQIVAFGSFTLWVLVWQTTVGLFVLFLGPMLIVTLAEGVLRRAGWSRATVSGKIISSADDPLQAVRNGVRPPTGS
jgi:hypothetical protein